MFPSPTLPMMPDLADEVADEDLFTQLKTTCGS